MVALNFSPEFADAVASGQKRQTIRRTLRARVGDRVQLYTGQRTKACRKLIDYDPVVIRTGRIEIDVRGLKFDGYYQADESADGYARLDGFEDFKAMRQWFFERYKTDRFQGFEIRWRFPPDVAEQQE